MPYVAGIIIRRVLKNVVSVNKRLTLCFLVIYAGKYKLKNLVVGIVDEKN
jgi:hypothetical protein